MLNTTAKRFSPTVFSKHRRSRSIGKPISPLRSGACPDGCRGSFASPPFARLSAAPARLYFGVMRKNYVLDANILLHDPASIFNFADNTVVIPVGVIEEIDRFKKEMTDRGYNARSVTRKLDALRGQQNFTTGVDLPNGGTLKVFCSSGQAVADSFFASTGPPRFLRVISASPTTDTQ